MSDYNECPTCTQDWVANTDYECGCCGRPASEHIRVTSLCRILRETQQREHKARAIADRLAGVLQPLLIATWREKQPSKAELAFAAWKESRQDRNHRVITWPHDADPFTSPDHDNDQNIYQ